MAPVTASSRRAATSVFRQPATGDQARLIRRKKIKQWVYFQRNEDRVAGARGLLSGGW